MNHARTLTRYACSAGIVAGLLVAVPSLAVAAPQSMFTEVKNAGFGTDCGQPCRVVKTKIRHSMLPGGVTRYTTTEVAVAASRYRAAALVQSAGRLVPHPGLQLAIAAAGFAWSQMDGVQVPDTEFASAHDAALAANEFIPDDVESTPYSAGSDWNNAGASCGGVVYANPASAVACFAGSTSYQLTASWKSGTRSLYFQFINSDNYTRNLVLGKASSSDPVTGPDYLDPEGGGYKAPVESDYVQLDQHLPAEIIDQVYNDSTPVPEWQDEISNMPGSDSVTTSGNVAPEVVEKAIQDQENLTAELSGQPQPYPDTGSQTTTATDEILDHLTNNDSAQGEESDEPSWDGEIPDFPTAEPEWAVETIDALPDWSIGFGAACPAPTAIEVPLYGTVTLDWQPACDLAGWIRGVVIGVCMILALYIVLGTRATTN